MGIWVSLLFIVVGAVIAFATEYAAIGWILLYVGAFGVGVSAVLGLGAHRRTTAGNRLR